MIAVILIILLLIVLLIRRRKHKENEEEKEESNDTYHEEIQPTNLSSAIKLSQIEEDPFATDFKEGNIAEHI